MRMNFIKAVKKLSFILLGKYEFSVFGNSSLSAGISPTDRGFVIAALDLL
jgi:hypothetical protein